MGRLYNTLFRTRDDDLAEAEQAQLTEARECLEWTSCAYHDKFMSWLDAEVSKPFDVDKDPQQLIRDAVRVNTLKEVISHIRKVVDRSAAVSEQARENV